METTNTVIIGASAAGLACAACLTRRSVPFIMLEQQSDVAAPWRKHYDRLHLHTQKKQSALPYLNFPEDAPVFVPRDGVIAYLEQYAQKFGISPVFNEEVVAVQQQAPGWKVVTENNTYAATNVIMATGNNRKPNVPAWTGMELYQGPVIHSAGYKNGAAYKGKQVLVVGFGNSACEISLCLHEYGAFPSLSVKGPVNIISRGNGGSAIDNFFDSFAWVAKLVPALIDSVNAPYIRRKFGDSHHYGLNKLPYGPVVQIVKHKHIPLLDIGTYDLIKKGVITVYPAIEHFTPAGVRFTDGREQNFDAVILGTGYHTALADMLSDAASVIDRNGQPFKSGMESDLNGLYFCGFSPSPLGMLKEIGIEAKRIAGHIQRKGAAVAKFNFPC